MRRTRLVRNLLIGGTLLSAACSGSVNCGGCGGQPLDPIPGGFDPTARIERAAEARLTQRGLDFIGTEFSNLATAYARMTCGPAQPVPCPTDFSVAGAARPTTCNPSTNACVDPNTLANEPVVGFQIDRAVQSGATVCRDDPAQPNPRACFAWLRLEGLALTPAPPNQINALV